MNRIQLIASKTYATLNNALKAAEVYKDSDLRYAVVCDEDGRYFLIFIGADATRYGVHHAGHCIVG